MCILSSATSCVPRCVPFALRWISFEVTLRVPSAGKCERRAEVGRVFEWRQDFEGGGAVALPQCWLAPAGLLATAHPKLTSTIDAL